jgi:fluoride ion exporter CrcB/FEX
MRKYVLVGIGGGLGSVLRFGITQWMAPLSVWPFAAVLLINISGCFLISFLNFLTDPFGEIYLVRIAGSFCWRESVGGTPRLARLV